MEHTNALPYDLELARETAKARRFDLHTTRKIDGKTEEWGEPRSVTWYPHGARRYLAIGWGTHPGDEDPLAERIVICAEDDPATCFNVLKNTLEFSTHHPRIAQHAHDTRQQFSTILGADRADTPENTPAPITASITDVEFNQQKGKAAEEHWGKGFRPWKIPGLAVWTHAPGHGAYIVIGTVPSLDPVTPGSKNTDPPRMVMYALDQPDVFLRVLPKMITMQPQGNLRMTEGTQETAAETEEETEWSEGQMETALKDLQQRYGKGLSALERIDAADMTMDTVQALATEMILLRERLEKLPVDAREEKAEIQRAMHKRMEFGNYLLYHVRKALKGRQGQHLGFQKNCATLLQEAGTIFPENAALYGAMIKMHGLQDALEFEMDDLHLQL